MRRPIAIEDFALRLHPKARLIGIDLGSKTIGLAISDVERRLASPLKTLPRGAFAKDAGVLTAIFVEFDVAGIVLGLLLLTPIFTSDLNRNEHDALAAGTAAVLDSRISPLDKIGVARDVLVAVDKATAEGRIPDVEAVVGHRDDSAYADLGNALQDQLDRAVTNAFSNSFLVSALLGLLALIPIVLGRKEVGV